MDAKLMAARQDYHDAWPDELRRDAANEALTEIERLILQEQFAEDMKELERVGYIYGKAKFRRTQCASI